MIVQQILNVGAINKQLHIMNKDLQYILDFIKVAEHLSEKEKGELTKSVKNADKELTISEFKLERTEKVKKTTAILLEETIEELEQKRKAVEEQNRELEIEASLERVRARTMGMQKSDELSETARVLFQQFSELGENPDQLSIGIVNESEKVLEIWLSVQGTQMNRMFKVSVDEPIVIDKIYDAWKKQKKTLVIDISGNDLRKYNDFRNNLDEYKDYNVVKYNFSSEENRRVIYCAFFPKGLLSIATPEPRPEETLKLLERFAGVFDGTYTRFLDLQKAEAQAREAKIEAALERVRSRTMAMHQSNELAETASVLFNQLIVLGIEPNRLYIAIMKDDAGNAEFWITDEDGSKVSSGFSAKLNDNRSFNKMFEGWKRKDNCLIIDMQGKELQDYFEHLGKLNVPFKGGLSQKRRVQSIAYFSQGFIGIASPDLQPEKTVNLLERFAAVFNLTYRRFLDLEKAEAQAREAIKQASLDRIRGEIASMRTAEDLNRITPIIWRELTTLEVPFIRCGVFIVDETQEKVQVYLTTPDGKSLGVLNLPFQSNELTSNTVEHWKKEQVYQEHWNKEEFINWTKSMMELGQVQNPETYQGSSTPPESLNLHFVPFTQGMLYVGDVSPLTDEKLDLVKTLADAFSIAYARYEDFKNLEEAKNKIELTLSELKSAQAQLVHSEKMASLGELTAGIAHEIKNPLNFVNNFSEISGELLDEIDEELENNNKEEILAILKDLKQNLKKINEHGKRADSIVKGMLLHSRGTAGEKTLTDINDLLEQYVNLAYHGMRATNKEFNITIEKDYDKTLEKINVVPQDLSRVFLNIINNGCYAAFERKKKSGDNEFFPTLKVSTKNLKDKVEIRIGDNGNGIPKDILDKIFQPFFTTKPTGEGTGLGLSLSYDIVTKIHGGELKVESEEGKHTEFIIVIPK